ncbi:hypothetical protein BDQ94DRAFT_68451 [Aspergillus welwitschiae]|uniref:Uncharacterized protein n=1 Tax=Aspergillus welwitschiae TaxID=1341132 RepID=A0A3F3PUW7_9EURO|nr:hypothetical protein BDQ94DRAFT_68451 [Aspergillus welwitschiae]RDH30532.1 hypothetical protein BDQ94DRAFT_68451 [Aspergillus welwitschiae]
MGTTTGDNSGTLGNNVRGLSLELIAIGQIRVLLWIVIDRVSFPGRKRVMESHGISTIRRKWLFFFFSLLLWRCRCSVWLEQLLVC